MSCLGTRRKKKKDKGGKKTQTVSVHVEQELKGESQMAVTDHSGDESFDVSRLENAKRGELQKLCKKAGLKANGKNVEMVARLKGHFLNRKNKDQSDGDVKCDLAGKANAQTEQQGLPHFRTEKTLPVGSPSGCVHLDCITTWTNTTRGERLSFSGDSQESGTLSRHLSERQGKDANCQLQHTTEASNGNVLKVLSTMTLATECSPAIPLTHSRATMNTKECMSAISTSQMEISEKETSVAEKQGGGSPGMNSLSISVTQTVDICSATSPQESVSLPTSTASTKWCVVDGILKQDDEKMWRQVKLKGGRPVVPNRFGKYIEFNLTPCKKEVPQPYQDNFICGTCVRKNENLQKIDKTMMSSREGHQNFCGSSANIVRGATPLATQISRDDTLRNSVKRKRQITDSTNPGQGVKENETNVAKKQKKDQVGSQPGTPASPQARRERGENILLPRNLNKPWKPKKTRETPVSEDPEFARRVEEIMKNTRPGSAEEQRQIMSGTSTAVCRSPT